MIKERDGIHGVRKLDRRNSSLIGFGSIDELEKPEKCWNGELMKKGREAEKKVIDWLRSLKDSVKEVIDVREWRVTRKLDVDCFIETIDGKIRLAEIKYDQSLGKSNNFLFEFMRINHFVFADAVFYLGWTFRSPAKYLLYYSPYENSVYKFTFGDVRTQIGKYVSDCNKKNKPRIDVIFTDRQKTTFNFLVPKDYFEGLYRKYYLT